MAVDTSGWNRDPGAASYKTVPAYPIFNTDLWIKEKEEEKRRKQEAQAALEQKRINQNELAQRRNFGPATNDIDAPSGLYQQRAKEVQANNLKLQQNDDDRMRAYWRLTQRDGQEAVAQRLASINDMWNAHNAPYSGSNVVFEFLASDFSLDEINNMFASAHYVLFDSGYGRLFRQQDIDDLWVDLRNQYNVSSPQQAVIQEVFDAQEKAEIPNDPVTGFILLSMLTPLRQLVGLGIIGKVGYGLARMLQALVVANIAIGEAAQHVEAVRIGDIEKKWLRGQQMLVTSASPLNPEQSFPSPAATLPKDQFSNPSKFEELQALRKNMNMVNKMPDSREDIKSIQEYFHSVGVGTELDITGTFDPQWQSAIIDANNETIRMVFDQQREAIELGYAPSWAPVNGDPYWMSDATNPMHDTTKARLEGMAAPFSDVRGEAGTEVAALPQEGWQVWFAKMELGEAEKERMREENPDRYAFWDMWGMPHTRIQFETWANRLAKNGWLQGLYGLPLEAALLGGGGVQAVGAATNLASRQRRDPEYQRRQQALYDYVEDQDFQPFKVGTAYYQQIPDNMNEAFARSAVMAGYLKGDPQAEALIANLDQQQSTLIQQRYADDWLLTMGYYAGADYKKVMQYGVDYPDVVRAATLGVYAIAAYANPIGRVGRLVTRPTVKPSVTAWMKSQRSYNEVGKVVTSLVRKNGGSAARKVGGSAAATVLNELYGFIGKNADKVNPKGRIVTEMAAEIVDAVGKADYGRVVKVLDGAPPSFVSEVVNATRRAGEESAAIKSVAGRIAARQTRFGDALSETNLFKRLDPYLGEAYANGAAIFPHLRSNKIATPKRSVAWLQETVAAIPNQWTREFVTKWTSGLYTHAPTAKIEFRSQRSLDIAYNAAITVSQDAAWALKFRNRWAAARSQAQYQRLISDLDLMYTKKYKSSKDMPLSDPQALSARQGEMGGQALAPRPEVTWVDAQGVTHHFRATQPEYLTEFFSRDTKGNLVYKQAVPDTVYQMYAASIHRAALWAPYNTTHAGLLGKAILNIKNVTYRYPVGVAHKLSTPLRQVTVMLGAPLLFQKHTIADTFRTGAEEGPFSIMEAFGLKRMTIRGKTIVPQVRSVLKRRMETILNELPPDVANYIQYVKARVHASESQWLAGTHEFSYKAKTIWNERGQLNDLNGSADALVRLTRGKAFAEWSRGGDDAVRAWLDTAEGKQFLSDGGWHDFTRNIKTEINQAVHPREIQGSAVAEFMENIVRQEWERLETALPEIMPTLKDMAVNERLVNLEGVKSLIRDNPTNNAVLSTAVGAPYGLFADMTFAGYVVGKAMAANKWNRDVMFDSTFTKQYNRLVKDGMEPRNAAEVAADVAELNTARVHFDLSRALAIEARHRWFAWFATKHRLYATYMVKLAAERPQLAAMVPTIMDWMDERNKRKGVSEYDKYDLVLDLGEGKQWRQNLGPMMWFAEYPLESSAAILLEKGASFVAGHLAGANLHPSPAPFGLNFTRLDALFVVAYDAIKSDGVEDNPGLQDFLNAISPDRRARWNRLISNQQAVALAKGENITQVQAFNRAKAAALKAEGWRSFKFFSGRFVGKEEGEIEGLLRDLQNQTDPEVAKQMIRDNPVLAMAINSSMDPVEKEEMNQAFARIDQWATDYQLKLEEASDNGTLIAVWEDINTEFARKMDRLTNPMYMGSVEGDYNETFAKYYGDYDPKEFIEALGLLLPLIPADSVWNTGRRKTADERAIYQEENLDGPFKEMLEQFGLTPSDTSVLLYDLLKENFITIPLAQWTEENPYTLAPYKAQNVARYLARGGETGVYRADQFLDTVQNETFRQWMGMGIGSSGKAVSSDPMMAHLSPLKKDLLGWNSPPNLEQAWVEYAKYDWAVRKWAKETTVTDEKGTHTISTSSNLFKAKYKEIMDPLIANLSATVDGFKNEYEFSQLRLDQRLRLFDVGGGNTPEDKGMGEFLGIVEDMWAELGRADNPSSKDPGVTPGSQTGGPIVIKYTKQVAALAKKNDEWWQMFRGTYPLSKFGFSTSWQLRDDPTVNFLYWKTEDLPGEELDEFNWSR